jgi:hypothetical protein
MRLLTSILALFLKQKGIILFEEKIFTALSTNLGQTRKFRAINTLNQKLATNSGQTLTRTDTNLRDGS